MRCGLYQLGDHVPLRLQCHAAVAVPVAPTACPDFRVYKDAGTSAILTGSLPIMDKAGVTGLFGGDIFLDAAFSTGAYVVRYTWASGGVTKSALDTFEVADGGDARGTPISMHFFEQRGQTNIVWQTDGGCLVAGRGPIF